MSDEQPCSQLQIINTVLNALSAVVGFLTPLFILYIKSNINHNVNTATDTQTTKLEANQIKHSETLKQHFVASLKSQPLRSRSSSQQSQKHRLLLESDISPT